MPELNDRALSAMEKSEDPSTREAAAHERRTRLVTGRWVLP